MEQGWLKLHRSMLSWEWYSDTNVTRLFLHLLLSANYAPQTWRQETIGRGQTLTSVARLSSETGLSPMQIRTALEKLKITSNITIKSTNKNSIITVCNYDKYQIIDDTEQQTTQQATHHENNKPTIEEEKKERINNKHKDITTTTTTPAPAHTQEALSLDGSLELIDAMGMLVAEVERPTLWRDSVSRKHKMDFHQIRERINGFYDSLTARGQKEAKTEGEWKRHFDSWLTVTLREERKDKRMEGRKTYAERMDDNIREMRACEERLAASFADGTYLKGQQEQQQIAYNDEYDNQQE